MIKNFLYELKISRLSYLLEVIRTRDFKKKINAYNKICKMNITVDMGLIILDEIDKCNLEKNENADIYYSLLLFVLNNPYDIYYDNLKKIFPKLKDEYKAEIFNILSFSKTVAGITLYSNLVCEFYNGSYDLPIGNISNDVNNFLFIFPKFYELLKKDISHNKVLILLSDYLNSGLYTQKELDKNKKYIENSIISVFKEALNLKLKDDYMLDNDYFSLRSLLESSINIEYYISNRRTSIYLTKLIKKKDNQLKLFILDNYVKKGKDISKINLNPIAKDLLSRYPLYGFLKFYNIEKLFPKKYLNDELLGESDLAINYASKYAYTDIPSNVKFLESRIIGNYKFNFYSFNTRFNYREEVNDPSTDYILKAANLDKKLIDNAITPFIGISGGFNKDINPSLIEYTLPDLLYEKYNKDQKEIINNIDNKIKKYLRVNTDKGINEDNVVINEETKNEIESKGKLFRFIRSIFTFNNLFSFVSLGLLVLVIVLFLYINGYDFLNLSSGRFNLNKDDAIVATSIKNENFREISYNEIFNQEPLDYYVLFFKKNDISIYYSLVDTIINNEFPVYYVDLRKEENNPIYGGNETGFSISEETFMKVYNRDYEYYVVGKPYIVKELKDHSDSIKKRKKELEDLKKQEELQAEKEAAETVKENND